MAIRIAGLLLVNLGFCRRGLPPRTQKGCCPNVFLEKTFLKKHAVSWYYLASLSHQGSSGIRATGKALE